MKMYQILLKGIFKIAGLISVVILITILTGTTFAAMNMNMGTENKNTTVTAADKDAFVALWKKAFEAGMFTPEQTKRLAAELDTASKKLAENWVGLNDFLQQKNAKKGDPATVQKRLDLKEAERALIISQTKVKLEEFLTEAQVHIILMAGFHGISESTSGEEHLKQMHSDMDMQMDSIKELVNDFVKAAEKLNQNCQAVTLEIIRTNLGSQTTM